MQTKCNAWKNFPDHRLFIDIIFSAEEIASSNASWTVPLKERLKEKSLFCDKEITVNSKTWGGTVTFERTRSMGFKA